MSNGVETKEIWKIDSERVLKTIEAIELELGAAKDLCLDTLEEEGTAILIIDMIKGFAKEGCLSSNRVNGLIPRISELLSSSKKINKVFLYDSHPQDAIEFQSYPVHAVCGTEESQIVDELSQYIDKNSVIIHKNSTNAMMTQELRDYLTKHLEIDNYIIIGDCTDICILQCALGLKSYFNELNISKKVIVPYRYVDTYDLDVNHHEAELMNLFALYNMKINGIELYKGITF